MKKENKTTTIKVRLSPSEDAKFTKNFEKSGEKTISDFIRSRTLSTEDCQIYQLRRELNKEQKKKEKCKMISADLCSTINQLKAGVELKNALVDLEKGVNALCHSLR